MNVLTMGGRILSQSTAFNFAGLMVARIGLGVFEAGFGPGIPLYMCKYAPPSRILITLLRAARR